MIEIKEICCLDRCICMGFTGKITINGYVGSSDMSVRLLTIGLQLALYIIIIRLLQTMVGDEISS